MIDVRNRTALAALVGQGSEKLMTASELARRVGCSPSTIDHLRKGYSSRVRPEIADGIERELGLTAGTIFEPHDREGVPA